MLLLVLAFTLCSCATGPYNNDGAWFAGQAAQQGASDAANAASQPMMFAPPAGGF